MVIGHLGACLLLRACCVFVVGVLRVRCGGIAYLLVGFIHISCGSFV